MGIRDNLKRDLCFGNLVWLTDQKAGSTLIFIQRLLNSVGVLNQEILFLTGQQFLKYSEIGFSPHFLGNCQVIVISKIEELDVYQRCTFIKKISLHKTLKMKFGLSLVLVSSQPDDLLYSDFDPLLGIDEKIHSHIEIAAQGLCKTIWSLSPLAADKLEKIYLSRGDQYLKITIFYAVRLCRGKQIQILDVNLAQQAVDSFEQNSLFAN